MTAGEALKRLADSLDATNVLSDDYKRHVTGWAYKAVECAHREGRASVVWRKDNGELVDAGTNP